MIVVRRITLPDIPHIQHIRALVRFGTHEYVVSEHDIANEAAYACVACDAHEVVGYAVMVCSVDDAELLTLAVSPTMQKKGIGACLVQSCMQHARTKKISRLLLELRASNTNAKRFYEHLGFTLLSLRRDYYTGPKEDALVMACILV